MNLVDAIKGYIDGDKSVRKVADDAQLTAELILLVRMIFADGEIRGAELDYFKSLCRAAFGIPADDVPDVMRFLKEFGYETSVENAAGMFDQMPLERKRQLLLHMLSIAKADNELHHTETRMIRRTAEILNISAAEIASNSG